MSNDTESVEMKRFWFTTWREDVLFHATPECHRVKDNVEHLRDLHQLPVAHIPVDSDEVGNPNKLKFCSHCVSDERFA
jgi:hypothetical protein